MRYLKSNKYLALFVGSVFIFFWPLFLQFKLPVPSDALVGLYHPWRDYFKDTYPNGYPYKNPLITDPVRQQYPYRILAISELKKGTLPKWNPFAYSGTPHLSNVQAAVFYPFNLFFWVLPDYAAWSLLVLFQPLLSGIFLYLYLRYIGLGERACFLGAITFSFSGFMVSWMEWNTVGHVALWIPLILLAKDKLIERFQWRWAFILIAAETSMLLAGHLQTALYVLLFTSLYLGLKLYKIGVHDNKWLFQKCKIFILIGVIVIILTSIQLIPALQFILASAREFDLLDWHKPDWFIPWQNLVQFFAPDFFGNPATGNYYGIWNYGEFIGYVALFPLLMAIFALLARRDKKTLFFAVVLGFSILMAVPNWLSRLPYRLNMPFISTLQPSRILVLIDFCLATLAALGLDYIVKPEKMKEKRLLRMIVFGCLFIIILWVLVLVGPNIGISKETLNVQIAKRNLTLPTGLFVLSAFGLLGLSRFALKKIILTRIFILILLSTTLFDLYRFFHKFTPFTDQALLFPKTATIRFLENHLGIDRMMTTDRRIMPPNVTAFYRLQNVDGYDPLYLANYGQAVAAWTRNTPDISPAAFNRILTPEIVDSFWTDLLGVKYVLSLTPLADQKLQLVFQEGETRVYENLAAFPRVFLAQEVLTLSSPELVVASLYAQPTSLKSTAYISNDDISLPTQPLSDSEKAQIITYEQNRILIKSTTGYERLLILTDIFYPDWEVYVNGKKSRIIPVDFMLRGIIVPKGESLVEFRI